MSALATQPELIDAIVRIAGMALQPQSCAALALIVALVALVLALVVVVRVGRISEKK